MTPAESLARSIAVEAHAGQVDKAGLPESVVLALRELQAQARTVNGGTPQDHPRRRASETLAKLLAALHNDHGVSYLDLAQACGVTHAAVQMRVRRHGYNDPFPSQPGQYNAEPRPRRRRPPASHCGRCGREMTDDSLGVKSDGRRYCKACNRADGQRGYQRRKAAG